MSDQQPSKPETTPESPPEKNSITKAAPAGKQNANKNKEANQPAKASKEPVKKQSTTAEKNQTKSSSPSGNKPKPTASKPSTKAAPKNVSSKTSSIPLIVGIIGLIVAIAAAVGAGYNWDQQQKFTASQQSRISELNNQLRSQQLSIASLGNVQTTVVQIGAIVTELSSELGKLGSQVGQLGSDVGQLGAQRGRVDSLEINFSQFTSRLETTLGQIAGRVNEISTSSRTDWQIAEVEYFLRLALDSLIIEGNVKTAQALLEAADRLVQEIDDVGLIGVRQAIADDLVAIRGIRVPDYQGMAFTLNALSKQVGNLRMPLETRQVVETSTPQIADDSVAIETTWWQRAKLQLAELGKKLSGLISIRRTDQPVEPLMSPEQQSYLTQNLHLMLEQAQLALLRRNQALFQQSLDKALGWIQTYYDPDDAATISFVTNLTALKDNQISLELPDISGSLRTFKQFQEQRLELDKQTAQAQPDKLEVNLQ
ncbi:MAG: uroporphyrinogen-III C-methyltransferase [Pseudomonadales bacterium]|nr:uroporphyrinogen-III C-methyltransferase [Pseudomonadales bacterium]